MSERFVLFTCVGLTVFLFVAIFGVSWLVTKLVDDDSDCTGRWLFTCMAYAITTAIFILVLNG